MFDAFVTSVTYGKNGATCNISRETIEEAIAAGITYAIFAMGNGYNTITIDITEPCSKCGATGKGKRPGTKCPKCKGRKFFLPPFGFIRVEKPEATIIMNLGCKA